MLVIGKEYEPYGTLSMIRTIDGERYYWFVDEDGSIAMLPADIFEEVDKV